MALLGPDQPFRQRNPVLTRCSDQTKLESHLAADLSLGLPLAVGVCGGSNQWLSSNNLAGITGLSGLP